MSDGRCIHCRQVMAKKTKDHVFPDSWYPKSTPAKVQRWTVPSCPSCNHKYGEMENEVFVPLALSLCQSPERLQRQGLSKKTLRALGIGSRGANWTQTRSRNAGLPKEKVLRGARPYSPEVQPHVLPGLGPHPEVFAKSATPPDISCGRKKLQQVFGKIVRGCEYWLANGRIVEPPLRTDRSLRSRCRRTGRRSPAWPFSAPSISGSRIP